MTLSSQCHFYLAGTDTESNRAHGTVGRGMRVTANDRHTRLSQTCFRSYYMDDTVFRVLQTVISQIEILRVLFQCIHLVLGDRVFDRFFLIQCRDIVVRHTSDLLRSERLQTTGT